MKIKKNKKYKIRVEICKLHNLIILYQYLNQYLEHRKDVFNNQINKNLQYRKQKIKTNLFYIIKTINSIINI